MKAIQVHHTTSPTFRDEDYNKPKAEREVLCRSMLNEMLKKHLYERNFKAMGYNFAYSPLTESLYGGREVYGFDPSGVRRLNADMTAFAVIGQYENTEEGKKQADGTVNAVTPTFKKHTEEIIKWLATEYSVDLGIDPNTGKTYTTVIREFADSKESNGNVILHNVNTLGGHKHYGPITGNYTDCPGALEGVVNEINNSVLTFPYYRTTQMTHSFYSNGNHH